MKQGKKPQGVRPGFWLALLLALLLYRGYATGYFDPEARQGKAATPSPREESRSDEATPSPGERERPAPGTPYVPDPPTEAVTESPVVPPGVPLLEYHPIPYSPGEYDGLSYEEYLRAVMERQEAEMNEDLRFFEELGIILLERPDTVCLKNRWSFDYMDLYRSMYGAFWVERYSLGRLTRTVDGEEEVYTFLYLSYYDISQEQFNRMVEELDLALNRTLGLVPPGADLWTAARIVHDELCRRVTYDRSLSLPHTHDLYGALVNGRAVCSGYASAFYHVMMYLGYPVLSAYSDDHAWNWLEAPCDQNYVDTTWDDLDLCDRYGNPYIRYDYFFIPAEDVRKIESHEYRSYQPYVFLHDTWEDYNYHRREGLYFTGYDWDEVKWALRWQLWNGRNLLTLRFENEADYRRALGIFENECAGFWKMMEGSGYAEPIRYWMNDDLFIINIGLYAVL